MQKSPPKSVFMSSNDHTQRHEEVGPRVPMDQLMEELSLVAAHQAALVAQLQARHASERSSAAQKDEDIACLKQQLAKA